MLKIEIEGIQLHYKNVSDLNEKIQANLTEVGSKRTKVAAELRLLNRQERALKRFLGIRKSSGVMPQASSDTAHTKNGVSGKIGI